MTSKLWFFTKGAAYRLFRSRTSHPPSTIRTSSSVKPYNSYTSASISRSWALVSACGVDCFWARIWVTREVNGICCSSLSCFIGSFSTLLFIHSFVPIPVLVAICLKYHSLTFELRIASKCFGQRMLRLKPNSKIRQSDWTKSPLPCKAQASWWRNKQRFRLSRFSKPGKSISLPSSSSDPPPPPSPSSPHKPAPAILSPPPCNPQNGTC